MKIIGVCLLGAAAIAAPVAAQPWGPPPPGLWRAAPPDPMQRLNFLKDKIERSEANGSIDRSQADRAKDEWSRTYYWLQRKYQYQGGHLSPDQRQEAMQRINHISQQVNWERARW